MAVRKFIVALLVGLVLAVGGVLSAAVAVGEESTRAEAKLADVDWAAITPGELEKMILAGRLDPVKVKKDVRGRPLRTHLLVAAGKANSPDLLDVLVKHGADINWTGKHKLSPLHIAADFGRLDLMRRLIDLGADVTLGGQRTPIVMVVRSKQIKDPDVRIQAVDLLLENGADLHATRGGRFGRVNLLSETVGRMALQEGNPAGWESYKGLPEYLVRRGLDVNRRFVTPHGEGTAIHIAASLGKNGSTLRALAKLGGDVNAKTDAHLTPLILVAGGGRIELLETLLELGADVNYAAPDGYTAIYAARDRKRGGFDDVRLGIEGIKEKFPTIKEFRDAGAQAEEILLRYIDKEKIG